MNSITGKAFKVNELDYFSCPKDVAVNCDNSVTQGTEWFIPTVSNGVHVGYSKRRGSTKPTPDSVKTVRVKDFQSGTTYWLLIGDDDTEAAFTDLCAACCDAESRALADVTVPTVLIEETGCLTVEEVEEEGEYEYFDIAPDGLPDGKNYFITASKNGVAATPSATATGFADLAALVTWANTNWASVGTFAESDLKVSYTSNDAVTGSLHISLVDNA